MSLGVKVLKIRRIITFEERSPRCLDFDANKKCTTSVSTKNCFAILQYQKGGLQPGILALREILQIASSNMERHDSRTRNEMAFIEQAARKKARWTAAT